MSGSASLFDASIWVALAFGSHPHHGQASREFEAVDSLRPAAFCRATQHAFLRIVSTPSIQRHYGSPTVSNDEVWEKWELLNGLPQVVWLEEPKGLETFWQKHARRPSASPKVWMDAYLAAFALGHGITLVTLDNDFANFPGLAVKCLLDAA